MSNRVVASFDSFDGDYCVDIRDAKEMRGWFPLHRRTARIFATDRDAMVQALASVAWLAEPAISVLANSHTSLNTLAFG